MIFRRLLERTSRASLLLTVEGYALSTAAHVAIIGGVLYVTADRVISSDNADSFTPVAYFIPKDKIAGMRPKQERITFMSTPAVAGGDAPTDAPRVREAPIAEPEPGPGLEEMTSEIEPEPEPPATQGDSVMTVLQVDTAAARYDDSAAPPYPPKMLEKRIEGSVAIQYVVDTTGFADTASVVILSATHDDFATSVKQTLPAMHFRPAIMNARKVRQLVQQLFSFKIDTMLMAPPPANKKPA